MKRHRTTFGSWYSPPAMCPSIKGASMRFPVGATMNKAAISIFVHIWKKYALVSDAYHKVICKYFKHLDNLIHIL